jgi:hypothetical protein
MENGLTMFCLVCVAMIWRIRALLLAAGLALSGGAHASDVLRLDDGFRALDLTPYVKAVNGSDYEFSIQNGTGQALDLVVERLPIPELDVALGLRTPSPQPLRAFSSDDQEFAASPATPGLVTLQIPANSVQTFLLADVDQLQHVHLWSPSYLASYHSRLQTVQLSLLSLVSALLIMALLVALLRRGAYAVVMAFGLIVLLVALRADNLSAGLGIDNPLPSDSQWIIPLAFAIGLLMTGFGHLNLIIRKVINRNYWTRVIILADICLLSSIGLWAVGFARPGFAGVLGLEIPHIGLSLTIACILLGVIFLPERRDANTV